MQSGSGQSPLHVAAKRGQLPFVQDVLLRASDVAKDLQAVGHDVELNRGFLLYHDDSTYCAPLTWALNLKKPELLLGASSPSVFSSTCASLFYIVVCRQMDDSTALVAALKEGHEAVADALIASGVDIDVCDVDGNSALHIAVQLNLLGVAQVLVEKHATVDVVNVRCDQSCPLVHSH